MTKKFGRVLNVKNFMWEFPDQSGVAIPNHVTSEILYWVKSGLPGGFMIGLGIKENYQNKHKPMTQTRP